MSTLDLTPAPHGSRLRWGIVDALTVTRRNLLKLSHQPSTIVATFAFPLVAVVLFGFVFGSAIRVPGDVDYRAYLMPGLFVMGTVMSMMGSLGVIAKDNGLGVMDRFRSMPMARSAVPLGQTLFDLILAVGSLLVMALCGLAFGWRAHNGVGATLAAFGLLLLLQYAVSWIGVYLGSMVKNEETANKISPLIMPVTMISNVFVPTGGMPTALQLIANWNPVSAAVTACRQLFGNGSIPAADPSLPMRYPILTTVGWSVLILAIFVPLSVRKFKRAGL